jgi:hypothetical protein
VPSRAGAPLPGRQRTTTGEPVRSTPTGSACSRSMHAREALRCRASSAVFRYSARPIPGFEPFPSARSESLRTPQLVVAGVADWVAAGCVPACLRGPCRSSAGGGGARCAWSSPTARAQSTRTHVSRTSWPWRRHGSSPVEQREAGTPAVSFTTDDPPAQPPGAHPAGRGLRVRATPRGLRRQRRGVRGWVRQPAQLSPGLTAGCGC